MGVVRIPKTRLYEQLQHILHVIEDPSTDVLDRAALREEASLLANLLQSHGDPITVDSQVAERYGWLDNS